MAAKFSLILFFITCLFAFYSCQATCTAGSMDLSSLTLPETSTTFYTQSASNGDVFYWNICGNVTSTYCKSTAGTAACQVVPSTGSQYSCGLSSTIVLASVNETTSTVAYSGGATCQNQAGTPKRQSTIYITCASGEAAAIGSAIEATCAYSLYMTADVCGGGFAMGWIGFTIILLAILLFIAYWIVGVIIKWKKYEATGLDLIPNLDFWKDLPFLFIDGWKFFINKITCGKVCGGYSSI